AAGADWQDQLRAVAAWLLSQPPMDLSRMIHADFKSLAPEVAQHLTFAAYEALYHPIEQIFERARDAKLIATPQLILLAGSIVSVVQTIHLSPYPLSDDEKLGYAHDMISVFSEGLRPRNDP
ncbi:MAG: hypothetical protein GYB68_12600, partial [Chloroflexi bacterium]|nr:hypothetical protein [Chloroflexota bacterium]